MNIFDIIGPVMVGPSSSHTAGAVKIGYIARKLMGEEIAEADSSVWFISCNRKRTWNKYGTCGRTYGNET